MPVRYDYTEEDYEMGEATLNNFSSPPATNRTWKYKAVEDRNLGRAMLRVAIAAEEVLAAAQARRALSSGGMTPEAFAQYLDPSTMLLRDPQVGGHAKSAAAEGRDVSDLYWLAQGVIFEQYRQARKSDPWFVSMRPYQPTLGAWQIPLIIVGGAALCVSTWLVAKEVAPAWAHVETERAWSAAKAYAEIRTNKALIAAGKPPVISDWARVRAAVARVNGSKVPAFAAGAGVGAIALVGAYYGLTKIGETRSRPSRAPRRENPRPRRRPRSSAPRPAKTRRRARRRPKRDNPVAPAGKSRPWMLGWDQAMTDYANQGELSLRTLTRAEAPWFGEGYTERQRADFRAGYRYFSKELAEYRGLEASADASRQERARAKPKPNKRTAKTVRANPKRRRKTKRAAPAGPGKTRRAKPSRGAKRDARGRFVSSKRGTSSKKRTRPKGRTRGQARGRRRRKGGRKSPTA